VSFLTSRAGAAPEGIGKVIRRREDPRLVSGAGCYTDDVNLPGQAYASMVRSPYAHARILRIDAAPALATPGVLAVLTGTDLVADGLNAISHRPVPTNPHEVPLERVIVDWKPLPAVVTSANAVVPGAPAVWDTCASNVAVETHAADAAATDAAFARAAHVVTLVTRINRVTDTGPRKALEKLAEGCGVLIHMCSHISGSVDNHATRTGTSGHLEAAHTAAAAGRAASSRPTSTTSSTCPVSGNE
jgi:carbon-monoxide dehydrogenase large subunit